MANKAGQNWTMEVRYWRPPAITDAAARDALTERLDDLGKQTVEAFRKAAPMGRTGNLRNEITYKVMGGKSVGLRITMPWYGKITIQGFPRSREARNARYMRIELKGGTLIFRKRVGPIAPNPWHLRAKAETQSKQREAAKLAAQGMVELLRRRTI